MRDICRGQLPLKLLWTLNICILFILPVTAIETYSCSNAKEPQAVPSNTVISLSKARTGGNLCTLIRITDADAYDKKRYFRSRKSQVKVEKEQRSRKGKTGRRGRVKEEQSFSRTVEGEESFFAPVARSYNGYDWERVAGPYRDTLSITCPSGINGDSCCDIEVPDTLNEYETFYLVHDEYSIGVKEEAARFFEQTTFGTTREYLQLVESNMSGGAAAAAAAGGEEMANNNDIRTNTDDPNDSNNLMPFFTKWLYEQMYEVPPTLHRALWRGRATSFMDVPSREGTVNHPCRRGARWRRGSFDRRDKDKIVTIEKMNGNYALSVDGHIRTMMREIEFENGNKIFDDAILPAKFKICTVRKPETHNK